MKSFFEAKVTYYPYKNIYVCYSGLVIPDGFDWDAYVERQTHRLLNA